MNRPPGHGPIRILLVDDHAVVRAGLRNLIQDEPDLQVAGEASNRSEALRLAIELQPDILILDHRLPDGSGIGSIDALKRVAPRTRVLVLTSFADESLLLAALKAGADGYLLKDVAEADLVASIRQVVAGGAAMPVPPVRRGDGSSVSNLWRLTGQERRVFELVGRGHSNRETASISGLTEKTVRNYLTRVFDKLGVRSRSELVALYLATQSWGRAPSASTD